MIDIEISSIQPVGFDGSHITMGVYSIPVGSPGLINYISHQLDTVFTGMQSPVGITWDGNGTVEAATYTMEYEWEAGFDFCIDPSGSNPDAEVELIKARNQRIMGSAVECVREFIELHDPKDGSDPYLYTIVLTGPYVNDDDKVYFKTQFRGNFK